MTIYNSPWPSFKTPSKRGVFDFIFTDNKNYDPKRAAIIDAATGVETSYTKLIDESLRFGNGLRNVAGLRPGKDTFLIFSPNSTLYPVLLFAATAAGVTVSTANSSYTPHELAHQVREASAVVLLVGSDLVPVAKEAAKELGLSEDKIYVLPGIDGKVNVQGLKSYEVLRGERTPPVEIPQDFLKNNAAFLPFSSGTTSKPKGVQISHSNLTSTCLQLAEVKGLFDAPEVVMGVLPLYHIYGLIVLLSLTLYNGGTVVLLPRFEIEKFCGAIQTYKCTVGLIVPPIALALAKHPIVSNFDLSSLRFFMSGAAPLSSDLQNLLASRLKGKTLVLQGFGMTETTSCALLPDINDVKSGTCGKLLSTMQARLVDEQGKDVGEGEPGELLLRGPNIMVKYHNNPEATAKTIDSEGWMATGDVCVRTNDGHYAIVDRRKEFIKYKGFQVIPAELEAVLLTCPMVADAAVIGVWEEDQATELPRAYVVVEPKYAQDKEVTKKIAKFVQDKVAPHKRLRGGVIPMEVIPKSPSGKILRKDLRVLAAKEQEGKAKL
ncbi:acetyl-CoA synthetase-like protein [Meredithblackwellia eburnea MCA 4105]